MQITATESIKKSFRGNQFDSKKQKGNATIIHMRREMKAHIINGSNRKNLDEMRRYFKIVFAMLHLDFGFGNERLNKALDGINRLSDEAKQDPIFWEHIDKLLIDEMKIEFKRENYEEMDK